MGFGLRPRGGVFKHLTKKGEMMRSRRVLLLGLLGSMVIGSMGEISPINGTFIGVITTALDPNNPDPSPWF